LKRQKKRKEPEDYTSATAPQAGPSIKRGKNGKDTKASTSNGSTSTTAPTAAPRKSKNTAVYVTRLPSDATADEVAARFSKCGVIEEDDEGDPKVKLYAKDDGSFSGDALVVYFKEESVSLAVAMLDEAELRIGENDTVMSVSQAEFGHKGEGDGPGAAGGTATAERRTGERRKTMDKKRTTRRIGKMQKYVLALLSIDTVSSPCIIENWKIGTRATSLDHRQMFKRRVEWRTRMLGS
jgi:HIV Tat-specific factor 1